MFIKLTRVLNDFDPDSRTFPWLVNATLIKRVRSYRIWSERVDRKRRNAVSDSVDWDTSGSIVTMFGDAEQVHVKESLEELERMILDIKL